MLFYCSAGVETFPDDACITGERIMFVSICLIFIMNGKQPLSANIVVNNNNINGKGSAISTSFLHAFMFS